MKPKPTNAELEILQVLWNTGPATVREVNEKLSEKRSIGYTTTLKLMQIMLKKNILTRQDNGKNHIYSPTMKENDIQKELVKKFLDNVFGGSTAKLVIHALGNKKTNPDELKEIRALITKLEKENGSVK